MNTPELTKPVGDTSTDALVEDNATAAEYAVTAYDSPEELLQVGTDHLRTAVQEKQGQEKQGQDKKRQVKQSIRKPVQTKPAQIQPAIEFDTSAATPVPETLPALRSELILEPAQFDKKGHPKWTLQDPLRGKYFRLGWLEFELLSRWHINDANKVLEAIDSETTLYVNRGHLDSLLSMLKSNELIRPQTDEDFQLLRSKLQKAKGSAMKRAFTFSMFYRKPLVNPDALLTAVDRLLHPVYAAKKMFLLIWLGLALFALNGVATHWYEFRNTFSQFMTFEGFMLFGVVLVFVNALHEVGHGLIAKHYRCRVTEMGVALIFMLPVCYCDTSDTWRLGDNKKRLLVSAGGILMELALATVACLFWLILPEGVLRTLAFFLTVTSLAATLFVNLNPFMKFDGYYLLADSLGVDNLQAKSFSNLRWQLRQWFIGCKEEKPYRIPESNQKLMNLYAASTWIYRLVLYFSICWMVYQFWFKALGLLLMFGVFMTMIATPVAKESALYVSSFKSTGLNFRNSIFICSLFLVVALLLIPLPRKVSAPAVLTSVHTSKVFATSAAKVLSVHFKQGDDVIAGQKLLTLVNPEIDYQKLKLEKELATLKLRKSIESQWLAGNVKTHVSEFDIKALEAALQEVKEQINTFELLADTNATVTLAPSWLKPGVWVDTNTVLAELASKDNMEVRAYVPAAKKELLNDKKATFFANSSGSSFDLNLKSIGDSNVDVLNDPALAVTHGGEVAVSQTSTGELQPIQGWMLAVLTPVEGVVSSINQEVSGYVMFPASAKSLIVSAFDRLYGVVIRESGF